MSIPTPRTHRHGWRITVLVVDANDDDHNDGGQVCES